MPFFAGALILLIGAFMIAAEARACAYERNNIGPIFVIFGVLILIGATIEALS